MLWTPPPTTFPTSLPNSPGEVACVLPARALAREDPRKQRGSRYRGLPPASHVDRPLCGWVSRGRPWMPFPATGRGLWKGPTHRECRSPAGP